MRHFNTKLLCNCSMNGDITTDFIDIEESTAVAIQVVWSAGSSPIGTLFLQVSANDGLDFSNYSNTISVSENTGNTIWNLSDFGFSCIRVFYKRTSGDGILNVYAHGRK